MRQRGLIELSLTVWLALGAIVLFVGMGVAIKVQTARLEASEAKYAAFEAKVRTEGEAAKLKAAAEKARNESVSKERKSSYEKRIADIASAYQRLCSQSGSCSGRVSQVPDTARSLDAETRDKQLQAVLRYADEQTARLIELQQWVREQTK